MRSETQAALRGDAFAFANHNMVGATVAAKYRLREVIGRGGNGTVYEAWDEAMVRSVAVKMPTIDPTHGDVPLKRFLREARTAGAIAHPHVCAVHDFGILGDGTPYLVMERLLGESLARRLRRKKKLTVAEAVNITVQLLSGMYGAHMRRFVHRDIKPGNIFLARVEGYSDFVKILDFGTSKMIGAKEERAEHDAYKEELTIVGMVLGTPYYMSPEQVGGGELDGRADVYSAGVVLYEMLTGERPFTGENSQIVFMKILSADGLAIRSVDASLPKSLAEIIYTATRRRMDDRHDAISLRKQLEAFARTLPTVMGDDEEPALSTLDQAKKKQDDLATLARVDELKHRFHELAVLHRSDKKPASRPSRDSDIPIVYEPDIPPPPSSSDFVDDLTEQRPSLTLPEEVDAERKSAGEGVESDAPPSKPRRHRA